MAEKSQDIFTEGKIDTIPVLREVRLFLGQYPAEDKLISFRGCRIAQVFAECKGPGDRNPSLFHPETSERNGGVAIKEVTTFPMFSEIKAQRSCTLPTYSLRNE